MININCLEMLRKIRDQMYLENKDRTDQEKIEFLSEAAQSFENNFKKKKTERKLKAA